MTSRAARGGGDIKRGSAASPHPTHTSHAPSSLSITQDLYSARLGGLYGSDAVDAPYIAGHDGVGVVTKVCLLMGRS